MHRAIIRSFCTTKKSSIVLIGTGWAGYKFLQHVDTKQHDITIISPRNHFVFTPLLAGTSVGTLEFRCVSEPIRGLGTENTYYEAAAKSIDFDNKTVHCQNVPNQREFSVQYDKLIIACGAVVNTFNTPGVPENTHFLKEIKDARKIRKRIIDCFELASEPNITDEERRAWLHFAVVGGGPTGVELASEIHDFMNEDVCKLYPKLKPFIKLTIFDVAPKILGSFDDKLAEYATKKFKREGTEIRTGVKIKEVKPCRLVLENEEIRVGMVIWATGLAPNSLVKQLPFAKDKSKRIVTDAYLHPVKENKEVLKDVYALGDCAATDGKSLPPTAQVAEQQGHYLAKAINMLPAQPSPFEYHHKGSLAYIGDAKALIDSPTQFKEGGRFAWLVWRSSYLTMTVSWRNKILILTHWLLKWLFGRDTSRF